MRIRRKAVAVDLLAKLADLLLAQLAVQEGAGIYARRRVPLDKNQISPLLFRCCAKKSG